MMNWQLTLWVTVNISALLYCRYLLKKGGSLVINTAPLFEELEERAKHIKTQAELEHYRSIFHAAKKAAGVGLTYSVLALVGIAGVVILNLILWW